MSNSVSRTRARISILSEILSFPAIIGRDWKTGWKEEKAAKVGDLVSMSSAPASKWYLSWLREIKNAGEPQYLLESIEDGALCWWGNIGLNIYSRERVSERPMWKWHDGQFAFYDRWLKVARRNKAYIILPVLPDFTEDGSVTLNVRVRFNLSGYRNPQTFPDWKKLTMKMMDEYFKRCVREHDALPRGSDSGPEVS